jgi:hypothetical protein
MKIGIYCRVSTTKQENGNQLDQLREFATKQPGWEVVAEFVDTVTGSGKSKRPQFEKMMVAASQRQFDLLLFWKLDRLSREGVRKTLQHLTLLDSYGVAWRSFMEPFFDSCGVMRDVVNGVDIYVEIVARYSENEEPRGMCLSAETVQLIGELGAAVDISRAGPPAQRQKPVPCRKGGCRNFHALYIYPPLDFDLLIRRL